jgi:predicted metalloprotease with PDZ domain
METGGRFKQSVAQSSFDAWTKFYQQDENAPNAIVSYYTKGALLAFVLDIEIRKRTDDKHSLDEILLDRKYPCA